MPATKIGLNLSNIGNITSPDIAIKNTTKEFLDEIPSRANEVSQGWLGIIILWGLWVFLIWKLSQQDHLGGEYSYSKSRAAGIAFGICGIIGLFAINIGYFTSYYHVVIFVAMTFIMTGVTWKSQR